MTSTEAKFILQAYRSGGGDDEDPAFYEALAQVQRDPALRAWFESEQTFDGAMTAKLAEVSPPAGLREAILAGGRVSSGTVRPRPWWRGGAWLAIAASFAVVGVVTLAVWPQRAEASTRFGEFALNDAVQRTSHASHGEGSSVLQLILCQPSTRLGKKLPVDFEALRLRGCREVGFKGAEVLEVCFNRDGMWFHCYIARRSTVRGSFSKEEVRIVDRDGASFAAWADESFVYVIVSKTGRNALQKLL
jgi:hypothetical protein